MLTGPPILVIGVNFAVWLIFHLGSAFLSNRLNLERFDPDDWLYRIRRWERDGHFYEEWMGVKKWKDLLPDGARLSKKGFTKKQLTSRAPEYLKRFVLETCRAELCHWLVLAAVPLFFIWNPWQIAIFMLPYTLAANMPCIIAQRYNRPRMLRVLRNRTDRL
jgi:glycosyl-4,4'-diaponeurosporenoate acyltransferase